MSTKMMMDKRNGSTRSSEEQKREMAECREMLRCCLHLTNLMSTFLFLGFLLFPNLLLESISQMFPRAFMLHKDIDALHCIAERMRISWSFPTQWSTTKWFISDIVPHWLSTTTHWNYNETIRTWDHCILNLDAWLLPINFHGIPPPHVAF